MTAFGTRVLNILAVIGEQHAQSYRPDAETHDDGACTNALIYFRGTVGIALWTMSYYRLLEFLRV